jgi:hypothetical protein
MVDDASVIAEHVFACALRGVSAIQRQAADFEMRSYGLIDQSLDKASNRAHRATIAFDGNSIDPS